jgi:redox-sensing transcriptional repressor
MIDIEYLNNPEAEMEQKLVPDIIVGRLPVYLRMLLHMADEGRQITSSQELGERLGISAAQIRKDLSQFGEFGKQGTGYNIQYLRDQLSSILHVDRVWDVAVIGAGDVGNAIGRYQGFMNRGFRVALIFDNNPMKVGTKIGDFVVQDMADLKELIQRHKIKIAMLTVPAIFAQGVTEQLIDAGIEAILNYAPIDISVPNTVHVQHMDPVTHLQRMAYYLK